jgi:uncharacterized protein
MVYDRNIELDLLTGSATDYTLARLMAMVAGNIKPSHLIKARECLENSININDLSRLKPLVLEPYGSVAYSLTFGLDAQNVANITGMVKTDINVICQRCLNPFLIEIRNEVKIGLAFNDDELRLLPEPYEPMLVNEDTLSLLELVEDEVLLSVPMAPAHMEADCPAGTLIEKHKAVKENPFAVLKTMKNKQD